MAVELIVQGGSFTLHHTETFNKARHRLNQVKKLIIDYENGNTDKDSKFQPFHMLSFRTEDDGRVSVDPAKVIGIESDEAKDVASDDDD